MREIFILFLFTPILMFSQEIFRGDIFISDLTAECIDTTYIRGSITNTHPPEFHFKKDKLVYELRLAIKLYGNEYFYNNALALTFKTPDNDITTVIINQELIPMTYDEKYEHILVIHSREPGWVNVEINEWDIHSLEFKNNINVNFLNYSFYIE